MKNRVVARDASDLLAAVALILFITGLLWGSAAIRGLL